MEIVWSLFNCESHESIAVALSHRYQQVVGEARKKIEAGDEKMLAVLEARAKMELFMFRFHQEANPDALCEDLYRHLGREFGISQRAFSSVLQQLEKIIELRNELDDVR